MANNEWNKNEFKLRCYNSKLGKWEYICNVSLVGKNLRINPADLEFDYLPNRVIRPPPREGELPKFDIQCASTEDIERRRYSDFFKSLAHGVEGRSAPKAQEIRCQSGITLYIMPPQHPHGFSAGSLAKICFKLPSNYPSQPIRSITAPTAPTTKNNINHTTPTTNKPITHSTSKDEDDDVTTAGSAHPEILESITHVHSGWIFGGFMELLHNSHDAQAKNLHIFTNMKEYERFFTASMNKNNSKSTETREEEERLHFLDDGTGMSHKDLVRMLSLGHARDNAKDRIGQFGVGSKSGTMRIGNDVLVLTRTQDTQSVGLLSKTYNKSRNTLDIPIVTWRTSDMEYDTSAHSAEQAAKAFEKIKKFSPFKNDMILQSYFERIKKNGTMLVIYNLKKEELDFLTDRSDIRIPRMDDELFVRSRLGQTSSDIPLDYSLRAFCEVMFLKATMRIIIRGSPVKTVYMVNSLVKSERFSYDSEGLKISLDLGIMPGYARQGLGGLMIYWHKVLIEPYRRVGVQIHNSDRGNGVVGIVECNNLTPLNNKLSFQENDVMFRKAIKWLTERLNEYFYSTVDKDVAIDDANLVPEYTWIQCDKCRQWRKLPQTPEKLPEFWFCYNNPDPKYASCSVPEENTDSHLTVSVSTVAPIKIKAPIASSTNSPVTASNNTPKTTQNTTGYKRLRKTVKSEGSEADNISSSSSDSEEEPVPKKILPKRVSAFQPIRPFAPGMNRPAIKSSSTPAKKVAPPSSSDESSSSEDEESEESEESEEDENNESSSESEEEEEPLPPKPQFSKNRVVPVVRTRRGKPK